MESRDRFDQQWQANRRRKSSLWAGGIEAREVPPSDRSWACCIDPLGDRVHQGCCVSAVRRDEAARLDCVVVAHRRRACGNGCHQYLLSDRSKNAALQGQHSAVQARGLLVIAPLGLPVVDSGGERDFGSQEITNLQFALGKLRRAARRHGCVAVQDHASIARHEMMLRQAARTAA
jgi:hypothetical protein